jgi:hypothetical protein
MIAPAEMVDVGAPNQGRQRAYLHRAIHPRPAGLVARRQRLVGRTRQVAAVDKGWEETSFESLDGASWLSWKVFWRARPDGSRRFYQCRIQGTAGGLELRLTYSHSILQRQIVESLDNLRARGALPSTGTSIGAGNLKKP